MAKKWLPGEGPSDEILVVEGADDYHFFGHFRNLHGFDGVFSIVNGDGVEKIVSGLTTRLNAYEGNHIGIVLDADENVASRWESVRYRLDKAGYENLPKNPDVNGTILLQADKPVVGIWLMPDNTLPGSLEHFVSTIRLNGESLWQRAVTVVDEIPEVERLFGASTSAVMKAKVHTWLAWQEEPGTPLGQALRKPYLNPNAPQAVLLAEWLRRLFATQI